MGDVSDKVAYFQAITGLDDTDLCTEILQAHNWDLDLAISSFTSHPDSSASAEAESSAPHSVSASASSDPPPPATLASAAAAAARPLQPSLTWKLITLPFSIVSGSLGLISGAVGLGIWAAGGVLSYSFSLISNRGGVGPSTSSSERLITSSVSPAASEAAQFINAFLTEYSRDSGPNFVGEGFMDSLARSRSEFKLLFVYLHSPDHPDTPGFCEETLCNETVATFINENFVAWGGSIRGSEGFKMSNSLKASRFPFCAVVMAATNQRISLLQQVEGPKTPEEMMMMLQRVLEESAPVLVSARLEAEERRDNMRLREEQDAAYRAALEADQARERQRREEQQRLEREAADAERKRREEDDARERAEREAAERAAVLVRLREEKAMSLGPEPEKGPNTTQVLVRFPTGERKDRRFHIDATIQAVYDYVDSLGCLEIGNYTLVSNFPRVSYGPDKLSSSLKEAGLHPQASLFVEMNS